MRLLITEQEAKGLFLHCGHTFWMKKKIRRSISKQEQPQCWLQEHRDRDLRATALAEGEHRLYTYEEENYHHHPINCSICFYISYIQNTEYTFNNFENEGKKRETESHTRAVISTVARYAFWIGIWDCASPKIFNQQPRGIFTFPPAQRAGVTEVGAFIATPCTIRTIKAESLGFDVAFRLWFFKDCIQQGFTVLSNDTHLRH